MGVAAGGSRIPDSCFVAALRLGRSRALYSVKLFVGTSGYGYKEWLGKFYPEDLRPKQMLPFYASRFRTVEINNTFYRLPKETVLASWAEQVPPDFVFVLKAAQKITHMKRLKDAGPETAYLFSVAAALGASLGAILFQLPPNMRKDSERLTKFLSLLPPDKAVAFEFRHPSWFDEEIFQLLRDHDCALCCADTDETEDTTVISTASWGYLRLRRADYSRADLVHWRDRILSQPWRHAYIFFKHEDEARGPRFAADFSEIAQQRSEG
jgi:uncharacterized protein YecE (DUF72 family)